MNELSGLLRYLILVFLLVQFPLVIACTVVEEVEPTLPFSNRQQTVPILNLGEPALLIFTSGNKEKGRQIVNFYVDQPGQYTLLLENGNPAWSGYWLIWDYISLRQHNRLIWEIGEDETPPDYIAEAFSEFCDPQPPALQPCTTEFLVGSTKVKNFSKDLNDGIFPVNTINFSLNEQQVGHFTLILSTLFSTHDGADQFEMEVTLKKKQ